MAGMKGVTLTAREYKLLLDAKLFAKPPTLALANEIWRRHLLPIVVKHLGRAALGRGKGGRVFDRIVQREVVFWDTRQGHLAAGSFSLRQRDDLDGDGKKRSKSASEITLKLRTPDLFIAAASKLPGRGAKARTKLEEDIAPLAVKPAAKGKEKTVRVHQTRSIRSRFSLSTKQDTDRPPTFGALTQLYPSLKGNLSAAQAKIPPASAKLVPGKPIREVVFEGATADLGGGFAIEFAMSVWTFRPARKPAIVEISYKCALDDGTIELDAAQRALALFVGLQEQLGKLMHSGETSKTALALPKRVGAP
jgi:hypothetical protein